MKYLQLAYRLFILCLFVLTPTIIYAFGGEINSGYGWRIHPIQGYEIFHAGVDIPLPEGTGIPAPFSGTIGDVGYQGGGHGNYIQLDMDQGGSLLFAHNSAILKNIGDHVSKGEIIALVGTTGGSTGPHIHAGYFPNGYGAPEFAFSANPAPILQAGGWNLSGDTSGNTIYDIGVGIFNKGTEKLYPNIDIDYTTMFKPADELYKVGKQLFDILSTASKNLQNNILNTLYLLMVLDLLWFIGRGLITNTFDATSLIPKFIRYSLITLICKSWDAIVKEGLIPFFETMGSTYGSTDFTVEHILQFDVLFNALSNTLTNYLDLRIAGTEIVTGLFTFLLQNILVCLILLCAIAISMYVLCKVINFYALCMLAILGLPLSFIPKVNHTANTMIGSIVSHLLELVIIAFLYGIILTEISHTGVIEPDKTGLLLLFGIKFAVVSFFISRDTRGWSKALAGITVAFTPRSSDNTIQ